MICQPFTKAELDAAVTGWGCNCGPTALAFAAQTSLDRARRAIPGFDTKKFTNPTMMRQALRTLGIANEAVARPKAEHLFDAARISLCLIQLTGPWSEPGAYPKWASVHTHWIATFIQPSLDGPVHAVFDVNGGARPFTFWHSEVLPSIIAQHKRRDGGWQVKHLWRVGDAIP